MNFFGTIWPRRLIRLKDILESGDLLFTCGLDDKKKQFFKQDLAAVHGFRKGLNSKK